MRIWRRNNWAYTLKVSEEAGAACVAPRRDARRVVPRGGLLTRLKFDGAPAADRFALRTPPLALAPVDAEAARRRRLAPTVAELSTKNRPLHP